MAPLKHGLRSAEVILQISGTVLCAMTRLARAELRQGWGAADLIGLKAEHHSRRKSAKIATSRPPGRVRLALMRRGQEPRPASSFSST
jgi:hypothetical protein